MSTPFRFSARVWMIAPLCAIGFLIWTDWVRIQHLEYLTAIAQEPPQRDPVSPTGYAGGTRELIVTELNYDSRQWIIQTQQMFAQKEWRIRRIAYENAPFGREVRATSPYRWWFGVVAWFDHLISGRPIGLAVERSALVVDALLHLSLLAGTTVFVAWRFGWFAATFLSLGLVMLFPLGSGFLPGVPDAQALAICCTLWSVLLLLAGIRAGAAAASSAGAGQSGQAANRSGSGRWFCLAGITGGLGLWVGPASQAPILGGIAVGALVAGYLARKDVQAEIPEANWRLWSLGGAATTLAACLLEFYPSHLASWELGMVHPLYGLAWLGGGELLVRTLAWVRQGRGAWNFRTSTLAVLSAAAFAALPVVMWKTHDWGFLASDLSSSRLTKLPGGLVAASLWSWLVHDGGTLTFCTTLLPVLLILPAVWQAWNRRTEANHRLSLTLALGPVLFALGWACRQVAWFNLLDGMLLVLLVAMSTDSPGRGRSRPALMIGWGIAAVFFALGAWQILPPSTTEARRTLSEPEVKALIDRDLAHWLAKRAGQAGAVVLAPLSETASLHYYGGLRGLATLAEENRDGLLVAVRIASATTPEEAWELINRRGVTHIVIPSWDSNLDDLARSGLGQLEGSFIGALRRWGLPPWLRPLPYQLPTVNGLTGQSVTVLEVVEEQDDALRLSREAEYFTEMGLLDRAATAGQALQKYPADFGALVAVLDVQLALGDTAGFAPAFNTLVGRFSRGADRGLPFDRRVKLAIILARGKQMDLARAQVQRCLAELDETGLRSLTTGSLYRLQVLAKAFGLGITDQRLRAVALDLLPVDFRSRLQQ